MTVVALAACGGRDSSTEPTAPVAPIATSLVLTDTALAFSALGSSDSLGVTVLDQTGQPISQAPVTWSSSDASVAAVTATGVVTSIANGSCTIRVASGPLSGEVSVNVKQIAAEVHLQPRTALVPLGDSVRFTASAFDAAGHEMMAPRVEWTSSMIDVAAVDSAGLAQALVGGRASIAARVDSITSEATLVAGPTLDVHLTARSLMPGQAAEADLTLRDGAGVPLTPVPSMTWTTSDSTVARVLDGGLVIGWGPGVSSVTARIEWLTDSESIDVQPAPSSPARAVVEFSPAVYPWAGGRGLSIIVDGPPGTSAVSFSSTNGAVHSDLHRIPGSTRFVRVLSPDEALQTCVEFTFEPGRFVCGYGRVRIGQGNEDETDLAVSMPRARQDMPQVDVTGLGELAQRSANVINIRDDGLRQDGNTAAVVKRMYRFFGDDFDYVGVVEVSTTGDVPHFTRVRNTVPGIGLSTVDNSADYRDGGSARLLGVIGFPNDVDLAHQVASHEMGHAFCCFLQGTGLGTATPHWPLSSAAFAIMGGNGNPASNAGWMKLIDKGDGTYGVDWQEPYGGFNTLELYLLGLADSSEVEAQVVFQNQGQEALPGNTLHGPVETVTIGEIVRSNGLRPRVYGGTPVTFGMALVVVSRGRLLARSEMAYFDVMARRGEATASFDDRYNTPFFINTRGRGILTTRLP